MSYIIAIVLGTLVMCVAQAKEDSSMYLVRGKQTSKVEAVISLAKGETDVLKCTPQELSDKATLRNRKTK